MSKPTVGIVGASGFVGSALVERLYFDGEWRERFDCIAFIHSFGNAARLARLPVGIEPLDLLEAGKVRSALGACDYVVNCTRGDSLLMMNGLENLIRAMKRSGTKKFVHLSSVAIYGEDPPPESAREDAPPNPKRSAYGDVKAAQDEMVFDLHRKGVPSIILCPSNIGGPYSSLIVDAVKRLLAGEIVLVDGGANATNIVHVDNLVQAILAALASDDGWGERYFVNETQPTTWKQFFSDMAAMLGIDDEFASISREDVVRRMQAGAPRPPRGIRTQVGTLVSRDFRNAVTVLPVFRWMDNAAKGLFNRLSRPMQERVRRKLRKPILIEEATDGAALGHKLTTVQIRRVYHSPEKIISRLGYRPLLDYDQGMTTTRKWLEFAHLIPSGKPIFSR